MEDRDKTKEQLISELEFLRAKVNDLEACQLREKTSEETLLLSEEKFRLISDTANDAIIIIDHNGIIYFWNQTAEEIFGYTSSEAIGRDLKIIIPNKYKEAHEVGFKNFIQTGERRLVAKRLELNAIGKGKSEFPVEVSLSAVQIKGKWNSIGIIRDITERKTMEAALRSSRDLLAEKVKERTRELTITNERLREEIRERMEMHEKLLQSEKLAALGTIAASISHDLRNPLNIIGNSTSYVDEIFEDVEEKIKKQLNIIHNAVVRSTRIISDILDFSKTKPPSFEKCDINNIIKEALYSAEIPGNITVKEKLDDNLPESMVDTYQMQRVFLNLITNAFRAMPDGGSLNIVSTFVESVAGEKLLSSDREKKYAQITFTDSGIGIKEENLKKIFEPLYTTNENGIGLGMSIVKDIIEKHRGFIEVQSKEGKGTSFTIHLPITI